MAQTIVKDILVLLNSNKTVLGLPDVLPLPDLLPETGDGISVAQIQVAKTLREYLNGKRVRKATFAVLVRTDGGNNGSGSLKAISWLEAVGALFEGMKRFQLSATRTINGADTTTPSIINRDDNNRVTYQLTIECEYVEQEG